MLKYLVCDLDDTLLYKHGESWLFDLTARNKEALCKIKDSGIIFCIASGRTYLHGKKILEMFDLLDGALCCGLNGSVYYDNGKLVSPKTVNPNDVLDMVSMVEVFENDYFNMQIQDLGESRNYYYPTKDPVSKYKKECIDLGIGIWDDTPLKEAIMNNLDMEIGKYSITSKTKESSSKLEMVLRSKYGDKYTITRSAKGYLEITNVEANKGNFIRYIKDTYHVSGDEIAVIGDNYNDISMFKESNHVFCMAQADDEVKAYANYVVEDVAKCIERCLEINEELSSR